MDLAGLAPSDLDMNFISNWRPGQPQLAEQILNSAKPNIVLQAPTGSGKSVIGRIPGQVLNQKTLILTRTIELQKQYEWQGVPTIFGRDHYICNLMPTMSSAYGVCRIGEYCQFLHNGCRYFSEKFHAMSANVAALNYAYFLRDGAFTDYDWIVCDEAHGLPNEIINAFTIEVRLSDIYSIDMQPPQGRTLKDWLKWGSENQKKLKRKVKNISKAKAFFVQRVAQFVNALELITNPNNWVLESLSVGPRIIPIWPTDLAGYALFPHGRKFIFESATIDPIFTMNMLGVPMESVEVIRAESDFPIENRPIYTQLADSRLNYSTEEAEYVRLIDKIEWIIDGYPNKRGLIHTGNYELAERIIRMARDKDRFIGHNRNNRALALTTFKSAQGAGKILVSPSMAEGIDLPNELCEFIIVAKMPYANLGSPLWQARFNSDEVRAQYAYASEAISLVIQACGRGVRSPTDKCDTYILDYSFLRELRTHPHIFPAWFSNAIQLI